MAVVFNDSQGQNGQQKNDIINKIIVVIQKLEEEMISNKRTITSKVNGNNFSITEKLREIASTIESIDGRVSTIGERTPEEIVVGPVQEMISKGYESIQLKASSDLVNKFAELSFKDGELNTKIDASIKERDRIILSLATDIVSQEERNVARNRELNTRINDINMSPGSSYDNQQLMQTIQNLSAEVGRLKVENSQLRDKIDREMFTEMRRREESINSINQRIVLL